MTRKQLVTRAEIAKMAGEDKRHFLNRDARHLQKPLGDIAGLTKLGFHLIEVPIGRRLVLFTGIFAKKNVSIFSKVPEQRALAIRFCRSKLVISLPIRLGVRRMTFAKRDHPY